MCWLLLLFFVPALLLQLKQHWFVRMCVCVMLVYVVFEINVCVESCRAEFGHKDEPHAASQQISTELHLHPES